MQARGTGRQGGGGRITFRRFAPRDSRPAKLQRTENEATVSHIGLYTEHNRQTLSVFWDQQYQQEVLKWLLSILEPL